MRKQTANRRHFTQSLLAAGGLSVPWLSRSPAALGDEAAFYLPDETAPHERTFMQWPVSIRVHPESDFLFDLQSTIAAIANTIAEFEPVVMLMDRKYAYTSRRLLSRDVEIWDVATEDLWARDSGPLFVTNGAKLAIRSFNFNGWGDKQIHRNDGKIAGKIAERLSLPLLDNGLVGEPGGVESDGEGTLLAHLSSWVNPNRNTSSEAEVSALLLDALGAEKIIWAPGVAGEDITDFHIDSLCRFTAPGAVLFQLPFPDDDDPFAEASLETLGILQTATDARGNALRIQTIESPENPRVQSRDFVASYANYYVCNGAVIMAEFGDDAADAAARDALQAAYPDREIIQLNVDPLGEVGGGIHCATQQQPRVG